MPTMLLEKGEREAFLDCLNAHVATLLPVDRLHIFLEVLRCMSEDEKIAVIQAMDEVDLRLFSSYADIEKSLFGENELSTF